jgi:hypothetical protein
VVGERKGEMTGWDSRIQVGRFHAYRLSASHEVEVMTRWEVRGSGARRGQKWKGGGGVALHRKGPERDLIRCLRSIGESRSHKSK